MATDVSMFTLFGILGLLRDNKCPLGEEAWKCDLDQMSSRGLGIVAVDNFRYPKTEITLTMQLHNFKGMENTLMTEANL